MPDATKTPKSRKATSVATAPATATATGSARSGATGDGRDDGPDELALLWVRWKTDAAPEAREKLILHYAPLVKYVASRVATGLPASIEQADLSSYGMFGLIDALEKFDAERGFKFETYAIPRIKGAIIDELRAMDWVPRSVRFKAREVEKAYTEIETREKRQPTEIEVAERLGVSSDELHEVINQISFVSVMALDEALSVGTDRGEQLSLIDTLADTSNLDPEAGVEDQETRGALAAAINGLTEREKVVLTLYYFEGLTLAEIGDVLGVTESRICQIHTKAVGELRTNLIETDGTT
jgi:RNA polymerase sigma factor for flagellar operon FliA